LARRRHRSGEPVRAGSILGRSFRVWTRNFVAFSVLVGIAYAPVLALQFHALRIDVFTWTRAELISLRMAIGYGPRIMVLLVTGIVVYAVFEQLADRKPDLGACLRIGLSRVVPLLLAGGLVALIWSAPLWIATMVGPIAVLIGALIALVLFCMCFVALPAVVVERVGPLRALGRSFTLTGEHRFTIFLVLFVISMIDGGAQVLKRFVLSDSFSRETLLCLEFAVNVVVGGLMATASTVTYHDLRRRKEGFGLDELRSVFA